MTTKCRIVELRASNVKRLKAVRIRPDGNVITIGGKNAAGKSSVLDSIMYALAGKRAIPDQPIRRGESEAVIELDLGDKIVRRRISAKSDTVSIESKDKSMRFAQPQATLDSWSVGLSFDPLAFKNMKPREQAEQVRAAMGLDFTELDARRANLFAERTDVNRDAKRLESQITGMKHHPDAPVVQVSVAALAEELKRRQGVNHANAASRNAVEAKRQEFAQAQHGIDALAVRLKNLRDEIARVEAEHDEAVARRKKIEAQGATLASAAAKLVDVDESEVTAQMADAERVNAMVRENLQRGTLEVEHKQLTATADKLTNDLNAIDADKTRQLTAAKFPIPNLTFTADGVFFNDFPFDQASEAEKLRVSVAIGTAQNPELRIMLVRNASLLDADSWALLVKLAEEYDMQLWMEVVSADGEGCSVLIEDGEAHVPESATV